MILRRVGSSAELARILRFAVSGGGATLLYGLLSFALSGLRDWSHMTIHVVAYMLCIPVSYLLHRDFSFRHTGLWSRSFTRFMVSVGVSFAIGTLVISGSAGLGFPAWVGTSLVMVLVPALSYVLMKFWIFPSENG